MGVWGSVPGGGSRNSIITTQVQGCWVALLVKALSVCDTVHAYGMAATPQSADAPYHYYRSGAAV
eukprot:5278369-Amphidinium_carterae.1